MDNDDLTNAFQQRLEEQYQVVPEDDYWGYFSYDESGAGLFLWFETREKMLEFLVDESAFLIGLHDADEIEQHEKIKTLIDKSKKENLSDESAITSLNELLNPTLRVKWWGTFRDLTNGQNEFSREVVEWFEENTDTSLERPLTELQRQKWLNFLSEYGL